MSESSFVVVNPQSQNGRTGRRWPELAARLRGRIGEFEVAFTERPRQAGELVAAALRRGATRVVSVGGDGTHNEVLQGFFADGVEAGGATLSVVPTGTGGDLRRTLGLPEETLAAIDCVGHDPRRVDAGLLRYTRADGATEESYFLNIASFGISGLVDQLVNQSSKALGGKVSFLWGTARAALRYKNQPIRLRLDGGEPLLRTINNVVVANARYFGGGMKVAPDADMSDGLFDVVIIGDLGTVELARGMGAVYRGEHIGRRGIEVFQAREVVAEPASPDAEILIDMDGEQPGRLPASFSIVPGALTLDFGPEAPRG
ncbi:MAG: diacylglycerol kinase family lipid kinase [Myxococcales bacterium]|nr:diacylglycerol kinase family lipid kinase [Myxococcales bacterium]